MGDFEDPSILGIFDFDFDLRDGTGRHAVTYMATGTEPPEDHFSTPIPPNATATEVEEHRLKLAEAVRKEQAEREFFCLEQVTAQELSRYHQQRIRSRLNPTIQGRALNFDDENDPARAAERTICENAPPGGSARPPPGSTANGAPPPPNRAPPRDRAQIRVSSRERDANGLPLFSTPMDNLVAGRAAADNITATGDSALQIQYVRALLAKAVEQQNAGADSQGRVYSRSSGSRAASSGRPAAANTLNCPPPERLQLQHRPANAALSTN